MSKNPPISFSALAKQANSAKAGGYPYQLKGNDLDKNFVFATLQIDESLVTSTTGAGGHMARKLKIPAVPGGGVFVLGAEGGQLKWIATESCET
jgi:hypothetical protein